MHLLAVLFASLLLVAVEPPDHVEQESPTPKSVRDYVQFGVGYLGIHLPDDSLEMKDVERWGRILHASDSQLQFMRSQYSDFVARHNEFMDREMPAYLEERAELSRMYFTDGFQTPGFVEKHRDSMRRETRLLGRLQGIERTLIDSFAPSLAEEQLHRLELLHLWSKRRYAWRFRFLGRWTSLELREIWYRCDQSPLSVEQVKAVEDVLAGYETTLTDLLRRQGAADTEYIAQAPHLLLDVDRGVISAAESKTKLTKLKMKFADLCVQIRSLNVRAAEAMTRAVSEEVAIQFNRLLKETVFPELYPDSECATGVLNAMLASPDLNATERNDLASLRGAYQEAYDAACTRLEAFCIEWGDKEAQGVDGYLRQYFPHELRPLLDERRDLAKRFIQQGQGLLGEERWTRLSKSASTAPAAE